MTPRHTILNSWDGPLPEAGHYVQTRAGTAYLVIEVKPSRPGSKRIARLELGKLEPAEGDELPEGAIVHPFAWAPRDKRAPRTRRTRAAELAGVM